jgi:hypothetical protein
MKCNKVLIITHKRNNSSIIFLIINKLEGLLGRRLLHYGDSRSPKVAKTESPEVEFGENRNNLSDLCGLSD